MVPSGVVKPRPPANEAPPGGVWQLTQLPASARYLPRVTMASAALGAAAAAGAIALLGVAAGWGAPLDTGAAGASAAAAAAAAGSVLPGQTATRATSSHWVGIRVRCTPSFIMPAARRARDFTQTPSRRSTATFCERLWCCIAGRGYRAAILPLFTPYVGAGALLAEARISAAPGRVVGLCFCSWIGCRGRYTFRSI